MSLQQEHSMEDVAKALGMSYRWVREQVRQGAAHQRYGNRIRLTDDQVELLRSRFASTPAPTQITTGRRRQRRAG
jgi:hypothetical protein